MLKFKLDEHLPIEASTMLNGAGHDAVTVVQQQMGANLTRK